MSSPKTTLAWQRYDAGRAYNNSLTPNQYSLVHTNVEFFAGNQWLHLPQSAAMSRLPKPTFNIIKRIADRIKRRTVLLYLIKCQIHTLKPPCNGSDCGLNQ